MNTRLGLVSLLVILTGLSGCASMSADECTTGDWSAIGYEDGARGYTTDRLAKHRKACAKHGVTPDFAAYQSGRAQGLVEYCQPSRGFKVGANGGGYNGVCNANLEANFLDAYNAGRHLYVLRADVSHANSGIHSRENELEEIEHHMLQNGVDLVANETTQEERIFLLAELKDMAERTGQLEAELHDLYEVRARAEVELEHYQVTLVEMGY